MQGKCTTFYDILKVWFEYKGEIPVPNCKIDHQKMYAEALEKSKKGTISIQDLVHLTIQYLDEKTSTIQWIRTVNILYFSKSKTGMLVHYHNY